MASWARGEPVTNWAGDQEKRGGARLRAEGLVLDLDGTLVRSEDDLPHPADVEAVRELVRGGVPVVIATGRTVQTSRSILTLLGVVEPVIALLGAHTFDPLSGQDEATIALGQRRARSIWRWALREGLVPHLVTPTECLVPRPATPAEGLAPLSPGPSPLPHLGPFRMVEGEPGPADLKSNLAMIIPQESGRTAEAFVAFATERNLDLTVVGHRRSFMCVHNRADKGQALRRLARRRAWDLGRFVAMGNDITDLPVFEVVGTGAAVGSGDPELTSAAAWVLQRDDPHPVATCVRTYF